MSKHQFETSLKLAYALRLNLRMNYGKPVFHPIAVRLWDKADSEGLRFIVSGLLSGINADVQFVNQPSSFYR